MLPLYRVVQVGFAPPAETKTHEFVEFCFVNTLFLLFQRERMVCIDDLHKGGDDKDGIEKANKDATEPA